MRSGIHKSKRQDSPNFSVAQKPVWMYMKLTRSREFSSQFVVSIFFIKNLICSKQFYNRLKFF